MKNMRLLKFNLALMLLLFVRNQSEAQDLVMTGKISDSYENETGRAKAKKTFEFLAYSDNTSPANVDLQVTDEHFLGKRIAQKERLFNEAYTVKTPISPGSPTMKVSIRKPVIYTSVKKIERQLRKEIREHTITLENAVDSYSKVLDIAINIVSDETGEFEKEIENTGTPESLMELFTQRVTLRYL
jgi:hypothetical protein